MDGVRLGYRGQLRLAINAAPEDIVTLPNESSCPCELSREPCDGMVDGVGVGRCGSAPHGGIGNYENMGSQVKAGRLGRGRGMSGCVDEWMAGQDWMQYFAVVGMTVARKGSRSTIMFLGRAGVREDGGLVL